MKKNEILCIKYILNAQAASDAAKNNKSRNMWLKDNDIFTAASKNEKNSYFPNKKARMGLYGNYEKKENCIELAIKLIKRYNFKDINYYYDGEKGIVYFDIKRQNRKFQISFHNRLYLKTQGRVCRWSKNLGSCASQCYELEKMI